VTSIEAIGEAEAMSLLDYKYGFLQKVVRESDRDIMSFVTQSGQYRFKRMAYGLWGQEQEQAFNNLKTAICSSPVLVHFNNKYEIEVHTDGSMSGIGGALYHIMNGQLYPFYFQSWLLQDSEKSYTISEI
jgi:hypothetical protein